jgi:DUF438 domain-containing protein
MARRLLLGVGGTTWEVVRLKLTAKTKLLELAKEYPFLIDFMPTLSPTYSKLKSPFVRRTMGAIATMEKVAGMGGLELAALLNAVAGEIERRTGERIEMEIPGVSPPVSDEGRKETLKGIIQDIHEGEDPELLKARFADLIQDIAPGELAEVEQALIDDGLPETEVKELCSLHVEVFKEGLDKGDIPRMPGGHPVHTYMMENRAVENILTELDDTVCALGSPPDGDVFDGMRSALIGKLDSLSELDKHYLRKENQLFPTLEDHGITGPSQVMWAVHDDIRASMKTAFERMEGGPASEAMAAVEELTNAVRDMVYKEEHILFPMCLENFSEAEWSRVRTGEEDIGYSWIEPATGWEPQAVVEEAPAAEAAEAGALAS